MLPGRADGVTDIGPRTGSPRRSERARLVHGLHRRRAVVHEFEAGPGRGPGGLSLTPTHPVADGMVSAIVKATKPRTRCRTSISRTAAELPIADSGAAAAELLLMSIERALA